ncbi:hypothetical protein FRX31_008948 [Thalictrum thalictroides]|uniref:Uncharacterized protein n=1 Tax=Thalictrum thalictroides TaxID=46969 RepID=A0A7J6WY43_THATH|nr:hypothetical protein FRX31_008948 [Thalictrum thalictroides]
MGLWSPQLWLVEVMEQTSRSCKIVAYNDLRTQFVGRVRDAAMKIVGQVLEVTKILEEAFSVQKELLIKIKPSQMQISTRHC